MKDILNSIKKCLSEENYYAALFLTITIPSICGALESDNGEDSPNKYIQWYDRYVTDLFLKGKDCYKLRCSLLHQGKTSHGKSSYSRVLFSYPSKALRIHNNTLNDALNLDIPLFCERLIKAVKDWERDVQSTDNYIRNTANTIKYYPKGIYPYTNIPLIS